MDDRFRYFKLGRRARFVLAGGLYGLAATMQILTDKPVIGIPFIFVAWFVLALKKVTNKPKDRGLEEWRPVGDGEVHRIADNLSRSRRLRLSGAGPLVLKIILVVFVSLVTLGTAFDMPWFSLVLLDFLLFSFPALFFGKLKVHVPDELNRKISGFLAAMGVPRPADFVLTPYLRFDQDEQGRDVPEDLRLMLEPKRKPEDLVGVQFQSAINNGANGPVPYMYAVVLTKGKNGPTHRLFSTMSARGYEVEPGGDASYGTVVVRQDTGGGGYHTSDDDCERLVKLMVKALQKTG